MSAPDFAGDEARRQRLLEGWLPLAQEASAHYGWELGPIALEELVLAAAADLGHARSALAACAILWATYTRGRPDKARP